MLASGGQFHAISAHEGGYTKAVDWWSLGILIYRLRCGVFPFTSLDQILQTDDFNFEHSELSSSPVTVQFIKQLVVVEEIFRLGFGDHGFKDISSHEFFTGINWDKLVSKELIPPPILVKDEPFTPFSPRKYANLGELLQRNKKLEWLRISLNEASQMAFAKWDYVSRSAVELEIKNEEYWKDLGQQHDKSTGTTGIGSRSISYSTDFSKYKR